MEVGLLLLVTYCSKNIKNEIKIAFATISIPSQTCIMYILVHVTQIKNAPISMINCLSYSQTRR